MEIKKEQHVFIIGSKGIPARYGGFESFVDKLTFYQKYKNIQYHVACLAGKKNKESFQKTFVYNGAHCFNIKVLNIGPAKAVFYDLIALKYCISFIKAKKIHHPVIYILTCRIGPFIGYYKKQIERFGGHIFVNPDGHEWKREKWSPLVCKYWKASEKLMVKHANLIICDSKNIEKYIKENYIQYKPDTTFIAYGSETSKSILSDNNEKIVSWYTNKSIMPFEYYLVVGRFVPENNYETIIREFMKSKTTKNLVLITETEGSNFYKKLEADTGFNKDKRIKFVGTVYEQELLKKIRENAYGYFHGHEVGGTNPSLLEAMGSTNLNLLLNVGFNREVGEEGALYWTKEKGNLSKLISDSEKMSDEQIKEIGALAKKRIRDEYSWHYIVGRYEDIFLSGLN